MVCFFVLIPNALFRLFAEHAAHSMREFRQLLLEAEHYYDARAKQENRLGIRESIETPIKIAIIDDGVDVKDLEYTFIGGRTFCTRDEEHNLNNPYYVSANGHGTAMARNVWDICPAVQFYVLRLDDHPQPGEEHVRQITPQSAAQVCRLHLFDIPTVGISLTIFTLCVAGNPGRGQEEGPHYINVLDH